MIHLAVCDDDREFVADIKDRLHGIMQRARREYELLDFNTGKELEKVVERGEQFDIIFLDIELADSNGKQVAEKLRKLDRMFKLIFISHHRDEVFKVFPFVTATFIPKKHLDEMFEPEVLRILGLIEAERNKRITFDIFESKRLKAPIRIDVRQIIYFESDNRVVYMYTSRQKEPFNLGILVMDNLDAEFTPLNFFRSHRTTLVNMDYVCSYDGDMIVLDDNRKIRLSRRRKTEFLNRIYGKSFH